MGQETFLPDFCSEAEIKPPSKRSAAIYEPMMAGFNWFLPDKLNKTSSRTAG